MAFQRLNDLIRTAIYVVGTLIIPMVIFAAPSYTVPVGTGVKIDEHGTCRYANNASAAATIFISTNSPAEWTSFYSNTIAGVTWDPCCGIDFYRPASTCIAVGNGYFSAANDETRTACTNLPANAFSGTYSGPGGGVNSCPVSAVTCVTDYRRPTATTCSACTTGQYLPNANTSATCSTCTNVPAGAAGATYTGTGGGTNNCPYSAVTCATDYRRPTVTTCTACTSGQYNPNANTSATCATCTNVPANATSAVYSGTGGGTNNCPISSVTCDASFYRNTVTSCAACANGRYSPAGNTLAASTCTGACTNSTTGAASVTYSGPGTSVSTCPIGSVTCATDYRRPTVTTCTACTSGQYNPNANTSATCATCTNVPANAFSAVYSGTGGGTNNCPYSSVTCDATYYRNTTTSCAICNNGRYSADGNTAAAATCTGACTNTVAGAAGVTYSGPGSTATNCPIGSVTCATDYRRPTATTCAACTSGQYNPNANTSTTCSACTNVPANAFSAVYSGTGGGTNNCPYSSVTCDATYYRNTTTSCAICNNGRYSADGNTAAAATCTGACTNTVAGAAGVTYSGPGSTATNCPIGSVTCATDYRRPTATTCTACATGEYNPNANTSTTCSSCTNKPANATSAVYSGTGGGTNNCPISSVTCDASFYRNTVTSCAACANGRYSPAGNTLAASTCTGACTNSTTGAASVTYSGPGTSVSTCPIGSVTCATDYRRPTATTCAACTSGQYNPNGNTSATCSTCTNKPANAFSATYSGTGSGSNNCPISSVTCNADYYRNTTTSCAACGVGTYTASNNTAGSCTACTNKPANSSYTNTGGGSNNCPWSCNSGYTWNGSICAPDELPCNNTPPGETGYNQCQWLGQEPPFNSGQQFNGSCETNFACDCKFICSDGFWYDMTTCPSIPSPECNMIP